MAQVTKAQRYKLTLSKLDFISLVDDPAQPNATTLLIKRADGSLPAGIKAETKARFVKSSDELGLAFFWAFTSTEKNGTPHYDHHGDAVQADDAMVAAAMDFMIDANGAVDEMHDYEQKSRVVFAMPMTPEIAKAYGIETKQTGLMIAIKCTDEQLEKLRDGTYTGVSIAGLGTKEPIEARKTRKGRVIKGQLVTDEQDGHQHTVEVLDDGSLWCSYNTATGAEFTHNHQVIRGTEGAIEILADSGHSHDLAPDQPAVVLVASDAIVVVTDAVQMRRSPTTNTHANKSAAGDSPRSQPTAKLSPQPEGTMTTPNNDAKIIDLEKQVGTLTTLRDELAKIAKLSGTEKAYFDVLTTEAQQAFLAKSNADRAAAMTADAVEFTLDGVEYRKSTQGYALAKRLRDEVQKNERAEIEKQMGQTIPHLAGETDAKVALIKAVRNSGEIAEMQAKMLGVLKGGDAFAEGRTVAPGGDASSVDPLEKSASEQLDELTLEYAKANKVDRPKARVAVMKTTEGKRLYRESVGR